MPDSLVVIAVLTLAILVYARFRSPSASLPLPPGPKPLPLIGNLFDMPYKYPWLTYDKWFRQFNSDIVYANVAGTSVVILKTYEDAVELLERRSAIYSSRLRMPMVNELMGWDFNLAFMPYGERWKKQRQMFHETFNMQAVKLFEPHSMRAAHRLLARCIDYPDNVLQHIRFMTGSVILSITYDIEVQPENDPSFTLVERNLHALLAALIPAAFWVDFFPWLKYVPTWFPGAGFRRKAKEWSEDVTEMIEKPFAVAKQQINNGQCHTPSFTSYNLDRLQDESIIKDVAAGMHSAGSGTANGVLSTFILAMLKYPEVQRKAQSELDRVLKGTLPTLKDQDSLPYMMATILETFRWNMGSPFGLPHCLTSDDEYKGYHIPAGSMVIANAWSMLYDEDLYPDPTEFNPDRFLKDGALNTEVRDPRLIVFGFGRRICPGRYMALSTIWITTASILATMNIMKARDSSGNIIEPSGEYESLLLHEPKPFKCVVKPRSKEAEALVRSSVLEQEY